VTGPLENLSPGEAEELLVMADAAGDSALRNEIVVALDRDRVPDPIDDLREAWVPPIGQIHAPFRPRRRTRPMIERLVRDLHSDRVPQSRLAASLLGGWDLDTDAVTALRAALDHPDGTTRGLAALSLGHLADNVDTTWHRTLVLADDPEVSARDIGAAIVLMSRLGESHRRVDAEAALDRLRLANPAWSPDLRAFKDQLSVG
jgi:HEAT repeat protein